MQIGGKKNKVNKQRIRQLNHELIFMRKVIGPEGK